MTAEDSIIRRHMGQLRPGRLALVALLFGLIAAPGTLGALTRELVADAFVQVSSFVAMTLLLFYGTERLFDFDIGKSLKRAKMWQVPLAALLGATPGCGGAVVVVAAYSSGNVGFGAVVATLTATMGDAAFLLIATRPDAALVVLPLSFAVGVLSGWLVDRSKYFVPEVTSTTLSDLAPQIGRTRLRDIAFFALVLPGLAIGTAQLFAFDAADLIGRLATDIGLAGGIMALLIWALSDLSAMSNQNDSPLTRMTEETAFISIWVICAYLVYDYLAEFAGLDLEAFFQSVAPILPLIAVLVGLVPGCGPQVLVATLYINGVIPFAALIGNAISNDGDALFPAIALNPRAAIWATLVSTIPALIVSYGFYILAPGFMN